MQSPRNERALNMLEECERALKKNSKNRVLAPVRGFLVELRRTLNLGYPLDDSQLTELRRIWERH